MGLGRNLSEEGQPRYHSGVHWRAGREVNQAHEAAKRLDCRIVVTIPTFARLSSRGVDFYSDDAVRQIRRWRGSPNDAWSAGDGLRHTGRTAFGSRKGMLSPDEGRLRQDGNAERPFLLRDNGQTTAIGDAEARADPKRSSNRPCRCPGAHVRCAATVSSGLCHNSSAAASTAYCYLSYHRNPKNLI